MAFNDFVQTELPKRPFVEVDGLPGQMLVRSPNLAAIRELVWATPGAVPGAPSGWFRMYQTLMTAGVLNYTLPALPSGGVIEAFINGVRVAATASGVNLAITGYTAGTIESDDELTVYFLE